MTFAPDLAEQHRARRRELSCRCWTRPTPMSPATASTCRKSRRPASSAPDPDCVTNPDSRARPGGGRDQLDHLGDGLHRRLQLAEGRRVRRERAGRSTSAASRPSRGSISSGCPGCRGGAPASSGASGTTPSIWRTTSPRSATTWPTMHPAKRETRRHALSVDELDPTEARMAHTRIRKFNTKDTYPEQKLDNDLCQAVVTRGGRIVWLRGQCPQNLDDAPRTSTAMTRSSRRTRSCRTSGS